MFQRLNLIKYCYDIKQHTETADTVTNKTAFAVASERPRAVLTFGVDTAQVSTALVNIYASHQWVSLVTTWARAYEAVERS